MRLTVDVIEKSSSFINACNDRNRIPAIENFGAIRDQYDTIDLTDNEIRKMENFPKMTRLRNLFISNNQVCKVEPDVAEKLVSLEMLVLSNNKISDLDELEGLVGCKSLRYVSLLDNPVTKTPHYRLMLISKLPQLTCIDFRKVSQAEREAAQELASGSKSEATKGRGRKAAAALEGEEADSKKKRQKKELTANEIAKIKEQIKNASSMEEIARLEKILETGYSL